MPLRLIVNYGRPTLLEPRQDRPAVQGLSFPQPHGPVGRGEHFHGPPVRIDMPDQLDARQEIVLELAFHFGLGVVLVVYASA